MKQLALLVIASFALASCGPKEAPAPEPSTEPAANAPAGDGLSVPTIEAETDGLSVPTIDAKPAE